jgi:hypothetical protein
MADGNVQRAGTGTNERLSSCSLPASQARASCRRLVSEGVAVSASGLWTQAQPGGRKRSGQAVSGGLDGRRERPASGNRHQRVTVFLPPSYITGSGILPPVGETLYAALALDVTRMSTWNALTLMSNRPPFARLTVRGFGGSCSR